MQLPRNRISPTPPEAFVPCALDFHFGPYEKVEGLGSFLGAEWCRCRSCGSLLTRDTAEHRRRTVVAA